jgi:eukaryotic-like serine/threonine-protein kinase
LPLEESPSRARVCPRCGVTLPDNAPSGACPVCLMRLGLAGDAAGPTDEPREPSAEVALPWTPMDSTPTQPGGGTRAFPRSFSEYELLEEIGQGGMGVVYKARQQGLDRVVALKVIKGGTHIDSTLRERFATEARALGRIQHPNIVQIYEIGEEDGCPFFSMEFLEGGSLAARIEREVPAAEEAAQITETLATAIEAAHQAGVLHRDLKPANVLLGRDGTLKVTDFGLAKQIEDDSGQTPSGAVLGTPSYMAPEQARGQNREVAATTDVYALGATLYELLTGVPPFRGPTQLDTVLMVLGREPVPPSRLRPGLSRDLEAVCLKCLQKSPARRYPSAQALADDLGRWLRGESTEARPLGRLARVWRGIRRARAVLAIVGLMAVVALSTAVVLHGGKREEEQPTVPDPDAPLREIEQTLASGQAATLIGESGPPRWHRWTDFAGTITRPVILDGAFTFDARPACYLELLPRLPCERYRFRAEIRHESRIPRTLGEVGLYFGYREYVLTGGQKAFRSYLVHFMDADGQLNPGRPEAYIALEDEVVTWRPNDVPRGSHSPVGSITFDPARTLPGPWRQVIVEVTPRSIRGLWASGMTMRPFVTLSEKKLALGTQRRQKEVSAKRLAPGTDLVLEGFDPHAGLGLYASQSIGAFRNVVIEPLASDD